MVTALRHRLFGLAVLVAVTLALVATGFAHRMPSADDVAFESFVLANGPVGALCGDIDGDGLPDRGDCPACHIVATPTPPAADLALREADLILVATVVAPRENRAARVVRDPALGLRAPPVA